jgi:ankyrin repeat protein
MEYADETCTETLVQTPLQLAINSKQLMIVSLLSVAKAKVHYDDPASALCSAAGTGDLQQVKRLIDNGVDPNSGDYDRRTGETCTTVGVVC